MHDADFYRQMWETILSGQVWHGEMINRRKDGSLYVEEQTITPLVDDDGEVTHFIAIKQDVSERKRAEEVLIRERQRLKDILDAMPDGLYIVNKDYSIEYINPVIEKLFGPIAGRKCHEYFHDLPTPCEWCKNDEVFAGKPVNWEWYSKKMDKTFDLFDTCMLNADGSISKLEIFHDISARKQAEAQLERSIEDLRSIGEAERRQRELAEGLAHSVITLASNLNLEDALSVLLDQIRRSVPFQGGDITLFEGTSFRVAGCRGFEERTNSVVAMQKSRTFDDFPPFQQITATMLPVLVPDTLEETGWRVVPGMEWVRSYLAAPLIRNGQVTGIINLTSDRPGFFSQESMDRLMTFTAPAALALHNAQLYKAEQSARCAAETLSRAGASMTKVLDLDSVIYTLLEHIDTIIHPELSGVALLQGRNRLTTRAVRGGEDWVDRDEILSMVVDIDSSPLLQSMLTTQKSVLIPDTAVSGSLQALSGTSHLRCVLAVPLITGDKIIGVVGLVATAVDYFTQEHIRWVEALAGQAAVTIQNAWLFQQVRDNSERLQFLARRLVEVQENELRYVAQELHDEIGQALTSVILGVKVIENEAHDPLRIRAEAQEMGQVLENAMENLHRLAMDLRPAALDQLGVEAALRQHINAVSKRFGLDTRFDMIGVKERLTPKMEIALYRIVQEALNNIVRHANATHADVLIQIRGESLILIIEDNGTGFDPEIAIQGERLGIIGMRERAEMLGGKLTLESRAGKGTTVLVEMPYANSNSHHR